MHYILLIIFILCSPLIGAVGVFPGSIGAEVTDLDLSKPLSADQVEMLKKLLSERLVLIIRDQELSAADQVNFTEQFGDVEIAWDKPCRHPEDPRVHVINNEAQRKNPAYQSSTFYWHWDKSFLDYPTNISIAYFPSEPQPDGYGRTIFANLYLAYDELPEDLKEQIQDLQAVHSYAHMTGLRRQNYEKVRLNLKEGAGQFPDVIHPLVRHHPVTGKKVLNLDELFQSSIVGLSPQESKILHKRLLAHASQEHLIYTHCWKKGDVILWDNLALMHHGTPTAPDDSERLLHRTNTSSRPLFEGRAIVIGTEELPPNFRYDKLFARPLVMNTDVDLDLSELADQLKQLKWGHQVKGIFPHALIIVVGKKWQTSKELSDLVDFVADRHDLIENFALGRYLQEDQHERKRCGELSLDHLKAKTKILVSSWETYFGKSTPASIRHERERVHARILAEAFVNTPLAKSEEGWLAWLEGDRELTPATNHPWLLYFGGGQGTGRTTMVKQLQQNHLIDDHSIVVNTKLFFDHLQGDIPYLHKIKFWPLVHDEKKYLVKLISEIAISHGLNVVIDTYLLEKDHCKALTDSVRALGGSSSMVVLSIPLGESYRRGWERARNKESYQHHFYEVLMFHKLFAQNWSTYLDYFDTSLVIDPKSYSNEIVCLSHQGKTNIFDQKKLESFLIEGWIDPDELADKIMMTQEPPTLIQQELACLLSSPRISSALQSICFDSLQPSQIR